MRQSSNNRSFAEFFAGVGLVRTALEDSEWECTFANDLDPKKLDIYEKNFSTSEFVLDDIWNIKASDIPKDVALFTASFPCVDLSVAGNRDGLNAKRSGTFWAIIDLLKKRRTTGQAPEFVLLENVYGFLTTNGGSELKQALKALNEVGYLVDVFVVDAKHFTPQSRVRIFVVAVDAQSENPEIIRRTRPDVFSSWKATIDFADENLRPKRLLDFIMKDEECDWFTFETNRLPARNTNLEHVVERYPDDHEIWWTGERHEKIISQIPTLQMKYLDTCKSNDFHSYGTIYRRMRKGKSTAELRIDGIAGCLRTPKGGSSKQILAQAGRNKILFRLLTPREYARLQGVKDSFILSPKDTNSYLAMGDAVCVPAIRWIAENYFRR